MQRSEIDPQARAKRGRPRGEVSQTVLAIVQQHGPLTAKQVAQLACITNNAAWYTCNRLVASGQISAAEPVRLEGVNRPVARYEAVRSRPPAASVQLNHVWSRS